MVTTTHDEIVEASAVLDWGAEDHTSLASSALSLAGLVELLLKDQHALDRVSRTTDGQRELVPRLLAIGLAGYLLFGTVLVIAFQVLAVRAVPHSIAAWLSGDGVAPLQFHPSATAWWLYWFDGSAIILQISFALGLMGAIGICLPSFYFYGLLAGVRTTMLQVTTHALKGLASGAVALVGLLPLYLAAVLGMAVLNAPRELVVAGCLLGMGLPFIAGLWGTRALYIGFVGLSDTMACQQRASRECFLRRLLLAWSVCYTTVAPLMVFSLWQWMSRAIIV